MTERSDGMSTEIVAATPHKVQQRGYALPRLANGLTAKQEEFAFGVATGLSASEAYRRAYDCQAMKPSVVWTESSKLLSRPAVVDRVSAILKDRYEKSLAADAKWVRQHVLDGLLRESIDAKNPASVRVKALEMLGKVDFVAMFTERSTVEHTDRREPSVIEAEIRAKLESFLAMKTIDN